MKFIRSYERKPGARVSIVDFKKENANCERFCKFFIPGGHLQKNA